MTDLKKLYIGSMNDGIFIIDQPPRPSHDDGPGVPGGPTPNVIAKMTDNDKEAHRMAKMFVAAFNIIQWARHAKPLLDAAEKAYATAPNSYTYDAWHKVARAQETIKNALALVDGAADVTDGS